MTYTNITSEEGSQGEACCRVETDEKRRKRRRTRPQHELFENIMPLTPAEQPPMRQERHDDTCRHRGRWKQSCSTSILLWVALALTCCQNYQSLIPSVVAENLGLKAKNYHRRFLQNSGSSASLPGASIKYLELPTTLWTSKNSRDQFFEGNELRISPFDKEILYATNWAGDLRVISATDGRSIETVSPEPRSITDDGTTSTWSIYSNSGMSFGSFPGTTSEDDGTKSDEDNYNDYLQFLINNGIGQNQKNDQEETRNEKHFAVYSIVDEAPVTAGAKFLPKTRVVCVSIPEHTILWTSAGLPGTPNGSPLVYYTDEETMEGGDDDAGAYVVLTHNSVLVRPSNATQTTGHLTVLDAKNGHVKWTQSEWNSDEVPRGYGPPQVSHKPVLGGSNNGGTLENKNDVIIFTNSADEGRGTNGNIYSFQMKSSAELNAEPKNVSSPVISNPFDVRVLKMVRWSSVAKPAINQDGTNLFIGVTGNAVRGWNGIAKFTETANWSSQLVPLEGTTPFDTYPPNVAVSTAPVLSTDEERVFVVTVRNETVCLDAQTGDRKWATKTRHPSPILSEPRASPDNQRLYVVNSADGKMHAFNQNDGNMLWSFGCDEKGLPDGSKCQAPEVYADFALSYEGTVMYFGATDGEIAAIKLGGLENEEAVKEPEPSIPTTVIITFDDDGRGPLEFDRESDKDNALAPARTNGTFGVKVAGTIFAIVACLVIATISLLFVVRSKGIDLRDLRNYRLPRYGRDGEFHSRVTRSKGPDNHEDQIVATISADEESDEFNTLWVDPTHSDPKYYNHEGDESPSADRLSILLGTSNKVPPSTTVAPISDNFGFGQAVVI